MIPVDPHREIIDPRQLVRENGREALAELVAREFGHTSTTSPQRPLPVIKVGDAVISRRRTGRWKDRNG